MRRAAPLNPGQQSNLILFGRFVLKAINKLHPQKAALSANLDSLVLNLAQDAVLG
jgi:hypothetical protein